MGFLLKIVARPGWGWGVGVTAQDLGRHAAGAIRAHLDRNRMAPDDWQPAPTNRTIRPANGKGDDMHMAGRW